MRQLPVPAVMTVADDGAGIRHFTFHARVAETTVVFSALRKGLAASGTTRARNASIRILGWALNFGPPRRIVLASGAEYGLYHRYAKRYKEILVGSGVVVEERTTADAAENL